MVRLLSLALIACLWLPGSVHACSCMAQTVEEAIGSASAIFEARVESLERSETEVVATFAVTQSWRGVTSEHVTVRTASNSAACGYDFVVGVTYLVYAQGEPGALTASLCSRTAPILEAAADRAALGSGTIPVDVSDEAIEPVRATRTGPPTRAGCASCSAQRSDPPRLALALGLVLFTMVWRSRRALP